MNKTNESLTDDEVRQVSQLIEALDRSTLDFLQLDAGGVKVTISKGGAGPLASFHAPAASAPAAPVAHVAAPPAPQAAAPAPAQAPAPAAKTREQDGTVVIPAPLMGRFYSRPEPGSPPFVTVGSEVDADTAVGLIEVMKLFNTVQAGMRGTITEICVPDGEFIEFGAALFRVRPSDGRAATGTLKGS